RGLRGVLARASGERPGPGREWAGRGADLGEVTVLDAVYRRDAGWVCRDPHGGFRLDGPPRLLLPGSFNPLHHGHTTLADRAADRLGHAVAYELSIANVEKPDLPPPEVERRLDQFRGHAAVFVTSAPT